MIYGTRIPAGLTHATVIADFDFEVYSEAGYRWDAERRRWTGPPGAPGSTKGLPVIGAAVYAQDPSTTPNALTYDLKDGRGRRFWRVGLPTPQDLFDHLAAGLLIEAWNVGFERWSWEEVCVKRWAWPPIPAGQYRCAMAKARAHSLPGALGNAAEVLGTSAQKLDNGPMLKFCTPRNPTKLDSRTRIEPLWTQADVDEVAADLTPPDLKPAALRAARAAIAEDITDTQAFAAYNDADVEVESQVSILIPDLSATELRYWQDDQTINKRGVQIDMGGVHDCIAIIEQAQRRYGDELATLTGGIKPSELKQLVGWLHGRGVHADSLDEDAITALLAGSLPPEARRALEIRAAVGSASVKKVFALRNRTTRSGRLHDMYVYHGARTGRPTGDGVQSTNLPKAGPNVYRCQCGKHHGAHTMTCGWCGTFTMRGPKAALEWNPAAAEDALACISHRSLDVLETMFGDAFLTVAGALRGLFIASDGNELVSSDFTAIEGVVIACLAGEQWRVDAFANDEPMYLLSAERMFGVSVAEMKAYAKEHGVHHPLRQKGKGGELGLNFGGWVDALRQFGVDGADDELKTTVLAWRAASPAIVQFWGGQKGGAGCRRFDDNLHGLEGMAVLAVQNPGQTFEVSRLDGTLSGVAYRSHGDVLYCRVPSGGIITYHRPRLEPSEQTWRGLSLSFEGWNTNPKQGPLGWVRMNTYSGKLAENVTQRVARDKQMGAIRRCEARGRFPVVMHTYDEIVAEVPIGTGSVVDLESLMTSPDSWNAGWPIKAAGGWVGRRYRKG